MSEKESNHCQELSQEHKNNHADALKSLADKFVSDGDGVKFIDGVMRIASELERFPAAIETAKQFIDAYPNLMTEFLIIRKLLKETLSIDYKLKLGIVRDCPSCGTGDYLILNVCGSEWTEEEVDLLDELKEYDPDGLRVSTLYTLSKAEGNK